VNPSPSIPPPTVAETDLDVTVVMPCLDEARTLPACIAQARALLDKLRSDAALSGEIVVADNGSTDGSQAIAEAASARVVSCPVRGYGAALRYGILAARGRMIVMGDADGSYDFLDAYPMVERLREGFELCMGSRLKGEIRPGAMPWKNRYIGNPVLTGVLNLFFQSGVSDAHCGLRAFTKDAFQKIAPSSDGMEFASEVVVKAALLGIRRTEVPVTLHPDGRGRSPHLRPFRDGWRHLRYLMMLSPVWLYLLPGLALGAVGTGVFALLLATPAGEVAHLGRYWIGDHWMVLAMALLLIGHLSVSVGLAATVVSVRSGYRHATPLVRLLAWLARLEHMIGFAAVSLTAGLGSLGYVVVVWVRRDFGGLGMLREMILASTLLSLGMQTFVVGFLISIVAGNEAEVEKALRAPRSRREPLEPSRRI
jgi:glycosyltransferase involved in cell wall biosynthesis